MKIFLDTGDVNAIKKAVDTGLVDGVTTNPSHIAATGRPFMDVVKDITEIVSGPISAEVMAERAEDMVKDAIEICKIAPNVNVKIPMNIEGLKAVPILENDHGIKTNVTMIFSATQAWYAMKAGASYVSIVLSRLDAIGNESDLLVADAALTRDNFGFKSEIIAGSIKTQNHVLTCLRHGIDIVTIPDSLFWQMFKHNLTDAGLAQFQKDWQTVPK
jgi:transaldolase